MRFISCRGNTQGALIWRENEVGFIREALSQGFDVMVDTWFIEETGKWMLGRRGPEHVVPFSFLLDQRLWVHAMNGAALRRLLENPRVNCFWHESDSFSITSQGVIWATPPSNNNNNNSNNNSNNKMIDYNNNNNNMTPVFSVNSLGPNCVAAFFPRPEQLLSLPIRGICADDVGILRTQKIAEQHSTLRRSNSHIQLVVFDLDGVLVESKDLHYHAMNMALEEVGREFVIQRSEHETTYDGLSTRQKLVLLTREKKLPVEKHDFVFTRKQEITQDLMKTDIKTDRRIQKVLCTLKAMGFPLCVASNCIRGSVDLLLSGIGVMPLVDRTLSNEDVKRAKPCPDIYEKACQLFGVPPHRTLVVEDSDHGRQAAVTAGCHLLPVETPRDVSVRNLVEAIVRVNELVTKPQCNIVVIVRPWMLAPASTSASFANNNSTQHFWNRRLGDRTLLETVLASFVPELPEADEDSVVPGWPVLKIQYILVVSKEMVAEQLIDRQLCKGLGFPPVQFVTLPSEEMVSKSDTALALEAANHLQVAKSRVLVAPLTSLIAWKGSSITDLFFSLSDVCVVTAHGGVTDHWDQGMVDDDALRAVHGAHSALASQSNSVGPSHRVTGVYCFQDGPTFCRIARKAVEEEAAALQSPKTPAAGTPLPTATAPQSTTATSSSSASSTPLTTALAAAAAAGDSSLSSCGVVLRLALHEGLQVSTHSVEKAWNLSAPLTDKHIRQIASAFSSGNECSPGYRGGAGGGGGGVGLSSPPGKYLDSGADDSPQLNVVIPMVLSPGEIAAFTAAGFSTPKPLIDIGGKTMLELVLNNLVDVQKARVICIVRREHDAKYNVIQALNNLVRDADLAVVYAEGQTEGAACTTLLAESLIDNMTPLLIVNSDQFLEWDAAKFIREIQRRGDSADGAIVTFRQPRESQDTRWSYAAIGENGYVTEVAEKVVISEHATCGVYYWAQGSEYVAAAKSMIAENKRVNGIFYVAPTYNEAIADGKKFFTYEARRVWPLRTPHDVDIFWKQCAPTLVAASEIHPMSVAELERRGVDRRFVAEFDEIYLEMRTRNVTKIQSSGFGCDSILQKGENDDPRRCFALYTILDSSNTQFTATFSALLRELQANFGDQVIYRLNSSGTYVGGDGATSSTSSSSASSSSATRNSTTASSGNSTPPASSSEGNFSSPPLSGQFHWTLMQIISFAEFASTELPAEYTSVIQSQLQATLKPFAVHYTGVIAVPTGLLLVGYPTANMNNVREELRQKLIDKDLPMKEPYKNDIVHSTLLRVCAPLSPERTQALLDIAEKYSNCDLGRATISHISMSAASWRMRRAELPEIEERSIVTL